MHTQAYKAGTPTKFLFLLDAHPGHLVPVSWELSQRDMVSLLWLPDSWTFSDVLVGKKVDGGFMYALGRAWFLSNENVCPVPPPGVVSRDWRELLSGARPGKSGAALPPR